MMSESLSPATSVLDPGVLRIVEVQEPRSRLGDEAAL